MTASRGVAALFTAALAFGLPAEAQAGDGWASVPVFRIDGPPSAPQTLKVTPPRLEKESPGAFGAANPAKVIVEIAKPVPGLVVLVKVNPWGEYYVANSAFSGDPKSAKASAGYTASGTVEVDGTKPAKYVVDVWLKATHRSIPFTLVAYAKDTRRDVAELGAPPAADLPIEARALLQHFPGLAPSDLEDDIAVGKVLASAPRELFVFFNADPLDGEVKLAKGEPLLFIGEPQQTSFLTMDGERVYPSLDQVTVTKPAKVALPAKVRKAHPRPATEDERKLLDGVKQAEDEFTQCVIAKKKGGEGEDPMGDVEAASACGADGLDARKAAIEKKLEASNLKARTASFNALKKRLATLLKK